VIKLLTALYKTTTKLTWY